MRLGTGMIISIHLFKISLRSMSLLNCEIIQHGLGFNLYSLLVCMPSGQRALYFHMFCSVPGGQRARLPHARHAGAELLLRAGHAGNSGQLENLPPAGTGLVTILFEMSS